jgi:hypothetical protein
VELLPAARTRGTSNPAWLRALHSFNYAHYALPSHIMSPEAMAPGHRPGVTSLQGRGGHRARKRVSQIPGPVFLRGSLCSPWLLCREVDGKEPTPLTSTSRIRGPVIGLWLWTRSCVIISGIGIGTRDSIAWMKAALIVHPQEQRQQPGLIAVLLAKTSLQLIRRSDEELIVAQCLGADLGIARLLSAQCECAWFPCSGPSQGFF